MKNLLKYLIVAAFSLVLSGVADTDNTHLAFTVVTDVDGEYIQYQQEQCAQYYHSVYEPDGEIYAVNSSNSINNTLRLNKKNKRAGTCGKWCAELTRNPKCPFNEIHSLKVYKSSICNPFLAGSGHKLISLGKLII